MAFEFDDDRQELANSFESAMINGNHQYFDTHEFVGIIDYFLDLNEMSKAERAITNALKQHPNSLDILVKQADWLYETNMFEEAEQRIDFILEIDSNNSEACELKGDLLIQQGMQTEGVHFLQKALFSSQEKGDLLNKIGLELLQMDMPEKAINFFLSVLDEDISDDSALFNACFCFDLLDDNKNAIKFLQKYLDRNPYSQIAWHQLGLQLFNVKEYQEALESFDYAILIDEGFLGAHFEKAKCHEELGEYSAALSIYKHAQSIDDPTAYAFFRIGLIYETLSDNESALLNYFSSIHQDPMYSMSWYRISRIYFKQKNIEKAIEYCERSFEIELDNNEYGLFLASLYTEVAKYDDAEVLYQEMINSLDENIELWLSYANFLITRSKKNEAFDVLMMYITMINISPYVSFYTANLAMDLGRETQAVVIVEREIEKDPTCVELLKNVFSSLYNNSKIKQLLN